MVNNKKWYVYLLLCNDDSIYTGITNNLDKRLKSHQNGTASKYTRARLPVKLLWTIPCKDKSYALQLEYRIKKLSHENKLHYDKFIRYGGNKKLWK